MENKFELPQEFKAKLDEIIDCELSPEDLEGVAGGTGPLKCGYGYLSTHEDIDLFCGTLVNNLIQINGIDTAVYYVTRLLPYPDVEKCLRNGGAERLSEYLHGLLDANLSIK